MRIFGQLLIVDKQKVPYLYKTTSKEFEFMHKSYATAVAMETMTFQDGGYFGSDKPPNFISKNDFS
jgi:hypothetical protein